jgi:hypothetical protein
MLVLAAALAAAIVPITVSAADRVIISDEEPSHDVVVHDVRTRPDGAVTGAIVNRSSRTVRDVRLLIRHNWLWTNERHPGEDSLGRVAYHIVPAEIRPGESVDFSYRPDSPLPDRSDGRFETTVEVVGMTEIGR